MVSTHPYPYLFHIPINKFAIVLNKVTLGQLLWCHGFFLLLLLHSPDFTLCILSSSGLPWFFTSFKGPPLSHPLHPGCCLLIRIGLPLCIHLLSVLLTVHGGSLMVCSKRTCAFFFQLYFPVFCCFCARFLSLFGLWSHCPWIIYSINHK